jgi:hypothetical protein
MFGRLATLAHGLRVLVEALLYGLQDVFVLPACNPSLLASGATLFDGTALTVADKPQAADPDYIGTEFQAGVTA